MEHTQIIPRKEIRVMRNVGETAVVAYIMQRAVSEEQLDVLSHITKVTSLRFQFLKKYNRRR